MHDTGVRPTNNQQGNMGSWPWQMSGLGSVLQKTGPVVPRSPTLQADSLRAEPQGKPKNTEVGSLIPSPSDFPDPGIKPKCPVLQVDSLPTELSEKPSML